MIRLVSDTNVNKLLNGNGIPERPGLLDIISSQLFSNIDHVSNKI